MTVGELKKPLEGVDDDMLVSVENQGDEVIACAARIYTANGSHPGVWDHKTQSRIQGSTFWIGAA